MPLSPATIRRSRRAMIGVLAVGTTFLAFVLIVHALTPARISLTPTSVLIAILALLVLPACTIAAWAWDRSIRHRLAPLEEDDANRTREHPAGRVRPHSVPAQEMEAKLIPEPNGPQTPSPTPQPEQHPAAERLPTPDRSAEYRSATDDRRPAPTQQAG